MVNATTVDKLNELRLNGMAESFNSQLCDGSYNDLSFEDRFGLIVDTEWARRKNNKLKRLITKADFRYSNACIEDIVLNGKLESGQTAISFQAISQN